MFVREFDLSRRDLSTLPVGRDGGPEEAVRRHTASAPVRLELMIEDHNSVSALDGWLGRADLVWQVRGHDDLTPFPTVVAPAFHLAATVAHRVCLGPRPMARAAEVHSTVDAIREQFAGGPAVLPGALVRVWSLTWTGPAGSHGGPGIVDQGPDMPIWAVVPSLGEHVVLRSVRPLEIWTRLAAAQSTATSAT